MLDHPATRYLPATPREPEHLGPILDTVEELITKNLYYSGELSAGELSKKLCIPIGIISRILKLLADEEILTVAGGGKTGGIDLGTDFTYTLYPKGMERARNILTKNEYMSEVPVTFDEYISITKKYLQATSSSEEFRITPELVTEVFSKRIGYQELNHVIGQAAASRQAIFLYGGAGNGKTNLSQQIVNLLPPIPIPYAVEVNKQILKIFDESIHKRDPRFQGLKQFDPRWVVCEAPFVTMGGEMMLTDLDVKYDEKYKAYKAPPQVLANGGVCLIDDLGRQLCRPDEIFNRLIVPLENHIDFMVLGGARLEVLCDEVFIFSSNLSIADIADPAFLRRIPYKLLMRDPREDEYRQIWELMSKIMKVNSPPQALDYLLAKYKGEERPLKASQPRDLLRLIRNKFYYFGNMEKAIEKIDIDESYATYFPKEVKY